MRALVIAPLAVVTVGGCSLFTDLGGLSETASITDAASGEADTDAATASDATGGDQRDEDADAQTDLLFEDSFDDGSPLPRGWTSKSGSPEVAPVTDAPSVPSALRAVSEAISPSESLLSKVMLLTAKSEVTCSFAVKVIAHSGSPFLRVAKLDFGSGEGSILLEVTSGEWHYYGNIGGSSFIGGVPRTMTDSFVPLSLTVRVDGAVTVRSGAVVRDEVAGAPPFTTTTLSVGIIQPSDQNYEILIDDVRCTAQ